MDLATKQHQLILKLTHILATSDCPEESDVEWSYFNIQLWLASEAEGSAGFPWKLHVTETNSVGLVFGAADAAAARWRCYKNHKSL